jgi:AcrR family transcriptional regulator
MFRDKVKAWSDAAIQEAVSGILVEVGCVGLTMEDVAKRVGIAKGSLYLHTPIRSGLVAKILDKWADEVIADSANLPADESLALDQACDALFLRVPLTAGSDRPAMPCWLRTSPCPYE